MREKGERSMTKDEYEEMIQDWKEIIYESVLAQTNGLIKLSQSDMTTIEFLIRRFNALIVAEVVNEVGAVKQEDFIPELRRLCAEKFIEVYGVK